MARPQKKKPALALCEVVINAPAIQPERGTEKTGGHDVRNCLRGPCRERETAERVPLIRTPIGCSGGRAGVVAGDAGQHWEKRRGGKKKWTYRDACTFRGHEIEIISPLDRTINKGGGGPNERGQGALKGLYKPKRAWGRDRASCGKAFQRMVFPVYHWRENQEWTLLQRKKRGEGGEFWEGTVSIDTSIGGNSKEGFPM